MPEGRHLLVDGANILHAWPELRRCMKRDRDAARQLLVHALAPIHDFDHVRVTIVLDGRGAELDVRAVGGSSTFAVITTPTGMTADDVIEQLVGRPGEASNCLVATGDQAERMTITALGAVWISPEELKTWAERAEVAKCKQLTRLSEDTDRAWRRE